MPVEWQPVRQSRTHELVLQSIEEQVFAGKLREGDR
ncbi:GntR family transcriptional regulator, partial [Streptomyces pratensis]